MAKSLKELTDTLNPPKYKFWISPDARRAAAEALGRSKNSGAVEPLVKALSDFLVRVAAMKALANIPFSERQRPMVLEQAQEFKQLMEWDFREEFFNEHLNPEVMTLVQNPDDQTLFSEPESHLAAIVNMASKISNEKESGIKAAFSQGLQPKSRNLFRKNVMLLLKNSVFPSWPELEDINTALRKADEIIFLLGGIPDQEEESSSTDDPDATCQMPNSSLSPDALKAFYSKGLENKASMEVSFADSPELVYGLAKELEERYTHLETVEAAMWAANAFSLECISCGPVKKTFVKRYMATMGMAYSDETPLDELELTRGNAGVLATGRCPNCNGTDVCVRLERSRLSFLETVPEPEKAETTEEPDSFNVLFTGEILPDQDLDSVKKNFAALFKMDADTTEAYFTGKPVFIKKQVDRTTADKIASTLEKAGAKARVDAA